MKVRIGSWAWLPKSELTASALQAIKLQLTIIPKQYQTADDEETSIPICLYEETDTHLGVAREFFFQRATKMLGKSEIEWEVTEGDKSSWPGPLVFNGKLRPEQEQALRTIVASFKGGQLGGLLQAAPGWGKCLAPGTLVMRFDGTLVKVEDIVVGDQLMGPDSKPRTVQSLGFGYGPLYQITPVKGDPWTCNSAHVLTLVRSGTNEIVDISVEDFRGKSKFLRERLKQFTPVEGIEFEPSPQSLPVDPYFLGLWIGDGNKRLENVGITTLDTEISDFITEVANRYDLRVRREDSNGTRCPTYYISSGTAVGGAGRNALLNILRETMGRPGRIPHVYLTASRESRLLLLAGLIDSDGYNNKGCCQIVQKRKDFAEAIAFLARSLGFFATLGPKTVNSKLYWRVQITGDLSVVPTRLPRKRFPKRKQVKLATRTGITVTPVGEGTYHGFTLDGDGRFLLGDFTVTHNTVGGCAIIAALQLPTLILVHKEFLMGQWLERIAHYLPTAKVGVAQQDMCDYTGKHIVVGMIHSVAKGKMPKAFYDWPGLVIVDEVHRVGARTWAPAPALFKAKHRIGVTATPRRKDGAEDVFRYHLGPILFVAKEQRLKVAVRRVFSKFKLVKTPYFNPSLAPESLILRFLCSNEPRNQRIVELMVDAVKAGRKLIVLSKRINHLERLEAMLRREWKIQSPKTPVTTGYYIGGMTEEARHNASKAQVIFATAQFASEGLDIPALDTLFLVTPMGDVEQAVGRIQRPCDGKKDPIVVDFRDPAVRLFESYAEARERLYAKIT